MSHSIFISYSSHDKVEVSRLAKDLKAIGLKVWFDEWEILPGDRIVKSIQQGVEGCDYMAVWLTEHSVNSK